MFQIPQGGLLINALKPQANGGALTGDYISLKNVHKVWIIFHMAQGHAATAALGVNKATAVAPTGATAVTETFPIWYNLDTDTDILTRATDAASYTLDAALKTKLVIFQIDPSILADTYDCIAATVGASNAANIIGVTYMIQPRYPGDNPPSVIVD